MTHKNALQANGGAMPSVVRLDDYRAPKSRAERMAGKSFYEIYPMPFFNKERLLSWDVQATGDYGADIETGKAYAQQFLASCDGTYGWRTLLPEIVHDMAHGGIHAEICPDKRCRNNGIIIGFMGEISDYVMLAAHLVGEGGLA